MRVYGHGDITTSSTCENIGETFVRTLITRYATGFARRGSFMRNCYKTDTTTRSIQFYVKYGGANFSKMIAYGSAIRRSIIEADGTIIAGARVQNSRAQLICYDRCEPSVCDQCTCADCAVEIRITLKPSSGVLSQRDLEAVRAAVASQLEVRAEKVQLSVGSYIAGTVERRMRRLSAVSVTAKIHASDPGSTADLRSKSQSRVTNVQQQISDDTGLDVQVEVVDEDDSNSDASNGADTDGATPNLILIVAACAGGAVVLIALGGFAIFYVRRNGNRRRQLLGKNVARSDSEATAGIAMQQQSQVAIVSDNPLLDRMSRLQRVKVKAQE